MSIEPQSDSDRLVSRLAWVLDTLDREADHHEARAHKLGDSEMGYVNQSEASRLRFAARLVRDAIEMTFPEQPACDRTGAR